MRVLKLKSCSEMVVAFTVSLVTFIHLLFGCPTLDKNFKAEVISNAVRQPQDSEKLEHKTQTAIAQSFQHRHQSSRHHH